MEANDPALDLASTIVTDDEIESLLTPPGSAEEIGRLGRYRLLAKLGSGGMGYVFRALHPVMEREVALKIMKRHLVGNSAALARFHREVCAIARLHHPNIVAAFDADSVANLHFLVMEYVPGIDLGKLIHHVGPLRPGLAAEYIRQAATGLQHAHERGMVHRDVKPSNLILTLDGQIKVLDLGLARMVGDAAQSDDTQSGVVLGTPDYMAPEQARDPRAADIRSDIYSLGCTLYTLLTGLPPFPKGSPASKLLAHQLQKPEPLEKKRPDLPPDLIAVVRKMMAKEPSERYAQPIDAARALATFAKPEKLEWEMLKVKESDGGESTVLIPTDLAWSPTEREVPLPSTVEEVKDAWANPDQGVMIRLDDSKSGNLSTEATTIDAPTRRPTWIASGGLAAVVVLVAIAPIVFLVARRFLTPEEARPERITNSIGMKLALVPRGAFLMGSPENEPGRQPDEGPQHIVSIAKPFYMGVHEVTQAEYQRVRGENPSYFAPDGDGRNEVPGLDTERFPVERVSWFDAWKFCQTLSERPEEKQAGRVYRLPVEPEWEYACRAETTTAFSFGDHLPAAQACFNEGLSPGTPRSGLIRSHPMPVGRFPPNAFGLRDMHGNVCEWCDNTAAEADSWRADPTGTFPVKPRPDPRGADRSLERAMRGGAWGFGAAICRSAARQYRAPTTRSDLQGFRVVCEITQ